MKCSKPCAGYLFTLLMILIITSMALLGACSLEAGQASTTTAPPATSTSSEKGPVAVEGHDPEGVKMYPGAVLIAYIVPTCECIPEVQNWYAVKASAQEVFDFFESELEKEGWEILDIEYKVNQKLQAVHKDYPDMVILIYEESEWPDYPVKVCIEWTPSWR